MTNETKKYYMTTEYEFDMPLDMPTEEELDLMYEEYLKNRSFDELFEDIDDLPF